MSWLDKLLPAIKTKISGGKPGVKEGVWDKCPACSATLYHPELVKNKHVCTQCSHHLRISARSRLDYLLDKDTNSKSKEIGKNIKPVDKLRFKDTKSYADRLNAAKKKTGENDALIVKHGHVDGVAVVVAAFDFGFLGGSMGSVVGEKFVLGVQAAIDANCPFIAVTASGGARMQESLYSLMQMSKVSAALGKLKQVKLPYIVILTDPTTGGVSASLAMLGDIHIAEPNALICFAGPRVIEQTVRETLPEGFQRSEFLLEKGMVDIIIDRRQIPQRVASILRKLMYAH